MLVSRKPIWTKFVFILIFLSLSQLVSCTKNYLILEQDEISQEKLDALQSDGIITNDEQVYYLYTESEVSAPLADGILDDEAQSLLNTTNKEIGVLFTDKQVLSFTRDQSAQLLTVTAAAYDKIKNISYNSYQFGPNNSKTVIEVKVHDGDHFSLALPDEQQRDDAFFQQLYATWQASPKVAKLRAMIASGEIPSHHHQYDHTLSDTVKEKLREANILHAHETIELFFAPVAEAFLTQGYMFSSERIVAYHTNTASGELEIQSAQLADVSDIVVQSKYEQNADGSYLILPDTHLQVFVDGDLSFGFDDYDDSADRMVAYHAFRLWDKASPALKNKKNLSEGSIPQNKPVNGN